MPWFFRQLRDRFGVLGSFRSLARIHVWIVIGLVAVAAWQPADDVNPRASFYNREIRDPFVVEIGGDINDPRGFHPRELDDDVFRVAWVGGSSLQARNEDASLRRFIPSLVRSQIPEVDGREVWVDVYLLQAMRTWDEYVSVLSALQEEVDLLVVTLNPVWLFNDSAVSSWPNLAPTAAEEVWSNPRSWPLALSLVTPSDVLTGAAGDRFDAVNERWSYARELTRRIADWTPLDRSQPPEASEEVSELQRIAGLTQPVFFWSEHRNQRDPSITGTAIDADTLQKANPDRDSWNQQIVGWLGDTLSDADIPVVVYLAPIRSSSLQDPLVSDALAEIEARLATYDDRFTGEHLDFVPTSLSRELPFLEFRDLIHMWNPSADHVSDLLSTRICDHLERTGHEPVCQPLPVEEDS